MNDVPLVKTNNIHDINTSIIAIKKQLRIINEALGLIDIPDAPDLSPYVKKTDVVDVVESGNMNPVTSNAVVPVDEVTVGNMQSVTSNAVASALNGGTWENVEGINYKRIGKMIFLVINQEVIYFTSSGGYAKSVSTGNDIVIPERYRPSMEINTVMTWNSEDVVFRLRLTTEGKLQSWNLGSLKTLPTGSDKKSWQTAITYCL